MANKHLKTIQCLIITYIVGGSVNPYNIFGKQFGNRYHKLQFIPWNLL